jgi:SpoVK/Ycf46/Vps4 family AAA+-type ATPase
MIDHTIYRKMHNNALAFNFTKPETTHLFDHMPAFVTLEEEPSTDTLLLLPPDIHGFYLNEKKWVHLFVDSIYPVSWNTKAYERLVLPSETKNLVEALVKVRSSQRGVKQGIGVSGKRTDITAGKGNGLIMLLHGGPGTGKTLTAESVAEIAEMPLYRVTCGDIGTSAEAVEKYLNTVLHLGKIWNCVLLLDEADVFLEERSMSDLKRNSLVSVFLRILEYYDGILILTSNRVGTFDEAFKSRIQVALHYEDLNRSARKKIWENFIEMLEEDEEDVNFHEIKHHLDDLAGKELNGRQIRNALTTARQLAIYKNERLEWEHLTQALSVSSNFSAYLKHIQGHTDEQRARDIGLR